MVSHRPVLARLAFLLLLLSAYSDTQWVNKDEYNNCQTPDQQQGICKNIATCSPMVTVLRKASEVYKGRVPASVAAKLQAYTCGSDSIGSKVCCPFGPINLDLGVTVSNPSTPPDISRHQNLKLLPEDCGYLDTENRIVNGEDAYLNEFPWMALLGYKSSHCVVRSKILWIGELRRRLYADKILHGLDIKYDDILKSALLVTEACRSVVWSKILRIGELRRGLHADKVLHGLDTEYHEKLKSTLLVRKYEDPPKSRLFISHM
ncbi:hypothetical protein GWI33_006744 [Rhynchophorus ferrugineus]|uniref:Clip domain-containing protein n=1 Tax=Rhynchophorus ferrugineus TaxID=354439 RepID=A0A834IH51_RHYFE|nr:hypothetical protein GWI33_006744 [Rhynchophorus ferrugineus]